MNRKQLLQKLINYNGDIQTILLDLEKFGWDCVEPIVKVDVVNLEKVLQKFLEKNSRIKILNFGLVQLK